MKKLFSVLIILLLCIVVIPSVFSEDNQIDDNVEEGEDGSGNESSNDDVDHDNETEDNETAVNETDEQENETEDDEGETENNEESNNESETNETSDQEEEQVGAMVSPPGAKVRLLQLEKAITKNILAGNEIIAFISENNQSIDVTELNTILDNLEALIDEIHALPTEGQGNELANQFVDIKDRARDLIKQFREKAKAILKESDQAALRERIKNLDKTVIRDLNEKIKQARQEFNAWKASKILEHLGLSDEELIEKIKTGEITIDDVKKRLREHYHQLNQETKRAAMEKLREEMMEKRELHRKSLDDVRAMMKENINNATKGRDGRKLAKSAVKRTLEDREKRLENRIKTEVMENRGDMIDKMNERNEQRGGE